MIAFTRLGSSLAVLVTLVTPTLAQQQAPGPKPVAETEARTPEAEAAGFHLPPGFAIELVASEPMIGKPMNLAFDARGRLWVTSTVEYPFPAAEGTTPRDRVLILSEFGPDGKAGKVETFADGLNIPIGVLPLGTGDSALVHSIPSVKRYTDSDGDGKADRSDLAYREFGSKDTHGMTNAFTRGFDGWIYACHGFSNTSTVEGSDGQAITMSSGNIYRFQPDGSHAESFSHGQVNPFGLTFDPMGRLYSCDCHSKPIYQNLRGAYYPSFGAADDGLGFGPSMIDHDHGSTGIGGIAYYDADHFPAEYRDSIYLGNVVTGRVHRDTLAWEGSSPRAKTQPDIVSSDDLWFHPVDIELGPDGALYIADFYNRIIGHYEVPLDHPGRDRERGRIWRIVYKGLDGKNPPPTDPRPDAIHAPIADLIADLGHPNIVVRMRAADLLVLQGKEAVEPALVAILGGSPPWGIDMTPADYAVLGGQTGKMVLRARSKVKAAILQAMLPEPPARIIQALWTLHRVGGLDDLPLLAAAGHPDEAVRTHAARIWGDRDLLSREGFQVLDQAIRDTSPHVRRAAAEALGMHPSLDTIRSFLNLIQHNPPTDDHLRQVARIGLRDSLRDKSAQLSATGPVGYYGPFDQALFADVSLGIPSESSAAFLLDFLVRRLARPKDRARMVRHVARYGEGNPQPELVNVVRAYDPPPSEQARLLQAIDGGTRERGGINTPEVGTLGVEVATKLIEATDPKTIGQGIDLAISLHLTPLTAPLTRLALDQETALPIRIAAITAWGQLDPAGSIPGLASRLADATEPPAIRDNAAKALGASNRDDARVILITALKQAPASLQTTIATALVATKPGAEALLTAVAAGHASARPLGERAVAIKLEASDLPDVKARLAALLKDIVPADQSILALIDTRKTDYDTTHGGDATLGQAVFAKNCAACHQIDGQGARIGPQLDGIGIRGLDRLLEDVLDPNRNIDQAFRTTSLALSDGRVISGLLLRQDGDVLILADAEGKEVPVSSSTVEDRRVAQLSPMPANWGDAIEPKDFRNLMAYLLSKKPAGLGDKQE